MELKKEQSDAINHEHGNALVSASAGSGKTFVMIERLIRLIEQGKANLSQILAVTYTESAAADMKEKLKKALFKKVKEGNRSLASCIQDVDVADISTMHSFCGRLIRKYFYVAGVSPDFKVADKSLSTTLINESLDKTLKRCYAQKQDWFVNLVDKFSEKRFDKPLRKLIIDIYDFISVEAEPLEFARQTINNYLPENFDNLCKQYYAYLQSTALTIKDLLQQAYYGFTNTQNQKATDYVNLLLSDVEMLLEGDLYAVKRLENQKRKLAVGSVKDNEQEYKKLVVEAKTLLDETVSEFCDYLTDSQNDKNILAQLKIDAEGIVKLVEQFCDNYQSAKREENLLDFSDLEHFALKILNDQTVLSALKQNYKYIFFDEYQDVNGVQEKIVQTLSNDNVFMVGDLKQSIYGFRGSRAEFFVEKLKTMPQNGQTTLSLNHNFRSANAVIDLVNSVFDYSMTNESSGVDYTKARLNSGGLFPEQAQGRATVHTVIKEKQKRGEGERARVYDILEELVKKEKPESATSSLITRIIEEELHKKFYDAKTETFRTVTFGDIAILSRNRDNAFVTAIVNGLAQHGIPVVSEVSQQICQYPEIQTLINVLELIDNYQNDVALATTLKSAVGGFCEEDLAEIVLYSSDILERNDGFFTAYQNYLQNAQGDLADRVREFDKNFNNIRLLSDFYGAHDILQKIINQSGYKATLYASSNGDSKVARLTKFLSLSIKEGRKLTVKEFLHAINNDGENFECAEIADEDTVKVMTMHASKGLEYPVVIVCGLNIPFKFARPSNICYFDRTYGFAIKHFDLATRTKNQTILRGIISQKIKEQAVKEEMRLLYVALTRATYSLHLTIEGSLKDGVANIKTSKRFTDFLPPEIPVQEYAQQDLEFESTKKQTRKVLIGQANQQDLQRLSKNFAFSYPNLLQTKMPLKSSATNVISDVESNALIHYVIDGEDKTDTQRGNVAHKIMEYYSFNSQLSLKQQVEQMISNGVVTAQQLEGVNLSRIENALSSIPVQQIKDMRLFREKTFLCNVDADLVGDFPKQEKVLVQGAIDLLAVKDGVARVIDYKYSSLTPQSLEQKYRKQLLIYKDAVEKSLGYKVESTTLINLFTGDVIQIQ